MSRRKGSRLLSLFRKTATKAGHDCDEEYQKAKMGFNFDGIDQEEAQRHKFNAKTGTFAIDKVKVVMQKETMVTELPGATRVLYRCKIISKLRGADYYVAKAYRENVEDATREIYFIDCKMQILAKNLAEEYNKLKPPHRIDFLECFILEFQGREGSPLFAAEKFVEGSYEKHSSNNGYVEESHYRMTPHAFSHFSFVICNGNRMIVDVQGVGDLFTDPQVHCTTNEDFGIGNTGLVGMAKFFRTYRYNPLCEWLGLVPFKQSPYDQAAHEDMEWEKLAHDWKLSDLAKKPNPQRDFIRKRSAKVGADVHFQMAKMYELGSFGGDTQPCIKSAVFHCEVSAEMGYRPANIVLAKCYSGIPRDVLAEHSPKEDHNRAFRHWMTAAKDGDANAMYFVAQYYEGLLTASDVQISWADSVRWYLKFVDAHHLLEEEGDGEDDSSDIEMHRILAKIASMYETGGNGLKVKTVRAARFYGEAAEEAEGCMKAKMAAKYYEKQAELEGDGEEEDEVSDDDSVTTASPSVGAASGLSDVMDGFSLDGTPTPSSPMMRGSSGKNLMRFSVSGDEDSGKIAREVMQSGVDTFLKTFSSSFGGHAHQSGSVDVVPVGREEMKRMSSFIDTYKSLEELLEEGQPSEVGPSVMVRAKYAQEPPASGALLQEHNEYIKSRGADVSMAGQFGGAAGGEMMLLRMTAEQAADFVAGDPFKTAGIFDEVSIENWVTQHNGIALLVAAEAAMQTAAGAS